MQALRDLNHLDLKAIMWCELTVFDALKDGIGAAVLAPGS